MKKVLVFLFFTIFVIIVFCSPVKAEPTWTRVTATAYCSCEKCCDKDPSDKWYGITASGKKARWGTVAVDREFIKFRSTLRIEGFPNTTFRAEDVGGAIKGKHIDIWFHSHEKASEFGVKKRLLVKITPAK